MNTSPTISIVLCTYNNADSLAITLAQISNQNLVDHSLVELLVIDNNSPDHTHDVFEKVSRCANIAFRYFFEERQGLSHARNTGVDKACGKYILFTDDDADIPRDWVISYLEKIDQLNPDCLYSRINIIWDRPTPWWYTNRFRPYFVGLDYGENVIAIDNLSKEFFGKNFCLRKDLIALYGGFDPALGRNGSRLIAGEETIIYRKLVQERRRIFYFPDAPVGHRLKEREYEESNISKQFIDSAHSSYHLAKLSARRKILGRPLGVLLENTKAIFVSFYNIPKFILLKNKQELFFYKINLRRSLTLIKLWMKSE
jgi:glucosyl-dolichyl phosphate glucuronosyltransferase